MNDRRLQQIAFYLWPKYSRLIDLINSNALIWKFIKTIRDIHVSPSRLEHFKYINSELLKNAPIDYLEFGVASGDSIANWIVINESPSSCFYGFDTFTGMPERYYYRILQGAFSTGGLIPKTNDPRAAFIKGLFQETLPPFLKRYEKINPLVVHMDADLYSSSLFVLAQLSSFFEPGDIIMFDDFFNPLHEFRAWSDYCQSFRVSARPVSLVKRGPFYENVAFRF